MWRNSTKHLWKYHGFFTLLWYWKNKCSHGDRTHYVRVEPIFVNLGHFRCSKTEADMIKSWQIQFRWGVRGGIFRLWRPLVDEINDLDLFVPYGPDLDATVKYQTISAVRESLQNPRKICTDSAVHHGRSMGPCFPFFKFGLNRRSVGPCFPFFWIQTDSAVRGSLFPFFKIRTDSAVRESLHPPLKITSRSAVPAFHF